MQRSVIQLAGKTLVISLPRKWCKQNHVKKGDKLEVGMAPKALRIRTTPTQTETEITIDISGMASNVVWHQLNTAYRTGFRAIHVTTRESTIYARALKKKTSLLAFLHRAVQRWTGMEVVQQTKKNFTIREVSQPNPEEFDRAFDRVLQIVRGMYTDDEPAATRADTILLLEEQLNRVTDFCLRLLITATSHGAAEITAYTLMLNALEELGDQAKYFAKHNKLKEIDSASAVVLGTVSALQSKSNKLIVKALASRDTLDEESPVNAIREHVTTALNAHQALLHALGDSGK